VIAPEAELARAEGEVERLDQFIAEHPDASAGAQRMREAELEHAERVRATLRAMGRPA
jgi:hypothetical protein